ncbi:hypothetical protein BDN72DRAFT_767566 [Pluteus cervinus]|uniref:Uncharacterized protein n=1 Tax=Pluteus cervinus TaxID=181527 RepID=A0ACD3AW23_9AGAR|nr:hypothetical protein BDN72DRAFT_767566 [Pluteus cervinus]
MDNHNPLQGNEVVPDSSALKGRTIVCCFDGTGNKFGENSNVVRFFRALKKDSPEQLVYYQPGIGTYTKRQPLTSVFSTFLSRVDEAVALYLNDHVKEGYRFIMQNYKEGDKICVFGFSRGAHIARVVAGMLYKIGVLPPHNEQQVDFAFSVSQIPGEKGNVLSKEFRTTFSRPVKVEFVGVWDTVSSVGIIPRYHRNTSINYAVKYVRHALALDERRARFRPITWNQPTPDNEQDIDVDEPAMQDKTDRDEWVYEPLDRDYADVQEVWFTGRCSSSCSTPCSYRNLLGCHADIGGGSHTNKIKESLSYIPLRWMIKECFVTRTGIMFDNSYLITLGFDLDILATKLSHLDIDLEAFHLDSDAIAQLTAERKNRALWEDPSAPPPTYTNENPMRGLRPKRHAVGLPLKHTRDYIDGLAGIWDQLVLAKGWWALEYIPMLSAIQDEAGDWWFKRDQNFGRGRYIPFRSEDEAILVHESVRDRIEKTKGTPDAYMPAAFNWELVEKSGMLVYVA